MPDWKTRAGRAVLQSVWWSGLSSAAERRAQPFGAIFTLHHVSPVPLGNFPPNGHLRIGPAFLEAAIRHLKAKDVDFVDLAEATRRIAAPRREGDRFFVAFTLDDGYCNNEAHAAPVFRKYAVPYTVFVSPGLSEGTTLPWWEVVEKVVRDNDAVRVPFLPDPIPSRTVAEMRRAFNRIFLHLTHECPESYLDGTVRQLAERNGVAADKAATCVMDWAALQRLSEDPLCTIGAHSMTHARLSRLDSRDVFRELQQSREVIGEKLGQAPDFFAYPYGYREACGPREFALAAEVGYRAAFTTRLHALSPRTASNLHALPRLSLNGYYQNPRFIDVLISGLPGQWKERRDRYAG
jgi:peptidoglycan/xylan/chitin deacetylase (PgdA/CDA1 family)